MKKVFSIIITTMIVAALLVSCAKGPNIEIEAVSYTTIKEEVESPIVDATIEHDFSVITVGTGTPDYSETKANSSTIIQIDDKYYIVDCGEGSYQNLIEDDFDFSKVAGILFTHHHIDHTTDFFDIYTKCILSNPDGIALIGPPRTAEFISFYNNIYLDDVLYRESNLDKYTGKIDKESIVDYADITELIGDDTVIIDDLTITSSEMTHTMYNLAYRFEIDGKSIVVSGDTSYDEDLVLLSKDSDILVIDGSLYKENATSSDVKENDIEPFYEYGGNFNVKAHLSFEDMVKIAVEANVKTLLITHFADANENRINQSISKIKEIFDGEVIYASDMMEVSVAIGNQSEENLDNNIELTYAIVDTNQTEFYSNTAIINNPNIGESFYGQDASYTGNQAVYTNNNDGTISDEVTELMWAQDMGEKMSFDEALDFANNSTLGGYDDWRIPTIKELYSLIQFDGQVEGEKANILFIDTDYFNQPLGDTSIGEREIDAQTWSSTIYEGKTMGNDTTVFGVNFVDGRIKGYPMYSKKNSADNEMYFRLVRGNTSYGVNNFVENGDGTITDLATGLTWQQEDSGYGMDWEDALEYGESLDLAGYDDWRLPNAKELQSIVDYNRSLQSTNSAAIDEIFSTSSIMDIEDSLNYPYFWTSTSHLDGMNPYSNGVYIAFGEALGIMNDQLLDVHGAGAQRSDPKSGDENDYPESKGPQGDIRIVYNYVRCVRTN